MNSKISGIFNILATPFDPQERVDLESLRHLVEFQIDKGVYGLTILGVLGEAGKLSVDERQTVMDTVLKTVDGRIPVIVGCSHSKLETSVALAQAAVQAGADGVMIAPPPMDKPSDDDIIRLYATIAEQVDCPIVVQDFPPVNGVIMTAEMLGRLPAVVPNARYLKLEDPPLMEKIAAIRARTDQFEIFGGLGGMFLLEELQRGATGTMTGFAFSEVLVAVYRAFIAGDLAGAARIFDHYLPLIRYENQLVVNLSIRKELLYRRGAIAHPTLRQPFVPLNPGTDDEITWMLKRVGIDDPKEKLHFPA
jgi:4-hydroxy-tetrahydrodipicolinate synthase